MDKKVEFFFFLVWFLKDIKCVPLTISWCLLPEGEGCVALRAAQFCYREFQITLTHQGEKTGTLTGGIQLRTSEFKPTEKLYGEAGRRKKKNPR